MFGKNKNPQNSQSIVTTENVIGNVFKHWNEDQIPNVKIFLNSEDKHKKTNSKFTVFTLVNISKSPILVKPSETSTEKQRVHKNKKFLFDKNLNFNGNKWIQKNFPWLDNIKVTDLNSTSSSIEFLPSSQGKLEKK